MSLSTDGQRLADLVAGWQGTRVLVLGDALLDEWRLGETDRLCREAPVPVVSENHTQYAAGGAANTAVNLAALGAQPVLVAPIGDNEAGVRLRRCLSEAGVEVLPLVVPGWHTPTKRRVVAGDQLIVRLDDDPHAEVPAAARRALLAMAEAAMTPPPAAMVLCDYGYGALDEQVRRWLRERPGAVPVIAVDAHDLAAWADVHPTLVTPNYTEALDALGVAHAQGTTENRVRLATDRAEELRRHLGATVAAITFDIDGAVAVADGLQPVRTRAVPEPTSHTVGAGDAYLAAFTLALARGADPPDGAWLAQLGAASAICGTHTCVSSRERLLARLPQAPGSPDDRRLPAGELVERVRMCRAEGRRIVFTNGCFDLLHRGHVAFLTQARSLGDLLIVAVNSDASAQRLKGFDRPVNRVEDRTAVLAALSCVDYVVVFDEDSPAPLIEQLRPDVYVKGGDYRADLLSEAPLVERLGGQVQILDYIPDRSTSAVIERIRSRTVGSAP